MHKGHCILATWLSRRKTHHRSRSTFVVRPRDLWVPGQRIHPRNIGATEAPEQRGPLNRAGEAVTVALGPIRV